MFHFISFALTIGQGKYVYKRGKSQGILFSIFCGNHVKYVSDFPADVFSSEKELFSCAYLLKKIPRRTKILISPV